MSRPEPSRVESTAEFPPLEDEVPPSAQQEAPLFRNRSRDQSDVSSRTRRLSLRFQESSLPLGFLQATGEAVVQAPTFGDIRRGAYTSRETQSQWRRSSISSSERSRASSSAAASTPTNKAGLNRTISTAEPLTEHADEHVLATIPSDEPMKALGKADDTPKPSSSDTMEKEKVSAATAIANSRTYSDTPSKSAPAVYQVPPKYARWLSSLKNIRERRKPEPTPADTEYPTGYRFPPKHTRWQSTVIGAKAFWKFTITPFGFLIVIYGCNIVAWGGMLFLLLIGGGKAMCHPTCNDINSPRRKWIEWDSQILNALFCVTGLGLIPWRFRDLYYLMQYRLQKKVDGLRRLAGINRTWFRLEGSELLPVPALAKEGDIPVESPPSALALPETSNPNPPLTGFRAPPTKLWKLDFVIWMYIANTALQCVLCGFMWGLNRYKRPSWSTGTFVALACIVAAAAGIMSAVEGSKVKKIEGVPWGENDLALDTEKRAETVKNLAVLGVTSEYVG